MTLCSCEQTKQILLYNGVTVVCATQQSQNRTLYFTRSTVLQNN